ncbi:MAG: hypothetical protein H0X38_03635 [Planctomycetes bacterium]|nr:hypothetical protein [Planctomycetota bacterium]
MRPASLLLAFAASVCAAGMLAATETENHGIPIIPAPGPVVVDGAFADWDLSGGVFVCSDVENLRGRFASWLHLMYDQDNLYVLARWNDDTPMNNPGLVSGDQGFAGDCLQLRLSIAAQGLPDFGRDEPPTQRTTHVTAWRGRDGKDVIDLAWGAKFDQGGLKDAKAKGGAQAFVRTADGKGYVQELSIPWSVLAPAGWKPATGAQVGVTVEPNFGTESRMRVTTKDIFKAGVVIDRVFTFGNGTSWGAGTFAAHARLEPAAVRLSDGREFPVRMDAGGQPQIDWGGLYAKHESAGFVTLPFTMPDDGYVSLNVRNAQGQVVRQLLNAAWFAKGANSVKWDGLTNTSYRRPGEAVVAGDYTWDAIWHKGLGLRLVGWASNAGKAPFDSPGGNWGGDMGTPTGVATTGETMLLGWSGAEAGAAVVCTDLDGVVKWRHKRGGFGGAALIAASAGIAYVYDPGQGNMLYRLKTADGTYSPWPGSDEAAMSAIAGLSADVRARTAAAGADGVRLSGLDAADGKLWLTYGPRTPWGAQQPSADVVVVADAGTGKALATLAVPRPGDLEIAADGRAYVLSDGTSLLRLDPQGGAAVPVITGLVNATSLAIDAAGCFYVGLGEPANQVQIFSATGKPRATIGKAGGRPLTGPWEKDGMRFVAGLRVDARGRLWVMESDPTPKRISVWDAASGAFVREFFGPTAYGAGGGAISPDDPHMLIGHGSEWRIDAETGTATCIGVFDRRDSPQARLGRGPNGHLYAAMGADQWSNGTVAIYERLSAGVWKLRTELRATKAQGADTGMTVWADANDDGKEQPDEVKTHDVKLGGWVTGWYMPMTQTMIFYGSRYRLAPVSWTACGAPVYDPTASKVMAGPADAEQRGGMGARIGCGSEDGKLMVYNGLYGAEHSDFQCWDVEHGTLAWSYPDNYTGVHGGHGAPPAAVGMIRGAYDVVGSVKLPDPIGDLFVIATDKGEWHLLTGSGYYLSALFQPDGLKVQWPEPCIPGAIMDNTPPGMGAEDFGGAIAATRDGQLYIQAGKSAFIDLKVVGLEAVQKLAAGSFAVSAADALQAVGFRQALLAGATAVKSAPLHHRTVAFTGDVRADFNEAKPVAFSKSGSGVTCSAAYDATTLYLGWTVANDATPWINGATEPAVMYAKGDTVDFQLATAPQADASRAKAAPGDLRLSIGDPQGKGAVAVLYRPFASGAKHPRKFYSGTMKGGYEMESVEVLKNAKITVKVDKAAHGYVVEAAIPLADLGMQATAGATYRGDFGVTYGNPAGDDTVVRSHWSNLATDFVADEVWELVLEPRTWGVLTCE